jgi:LacI family transcriptional regulator
MRFGQRPAVALLIETSNTYARGLVEGVRNYVRQHARWSIYLPETQRGAAPPAWLARWRGDGIIARIENEAIAEAVSATRLPVVVLCAGRYLPEAPCVETDDAAIAEAAATHLMARGFRQLAFCGDDRFPWSRWRRDHFRRLVEARGCHCHAYESPPEGENAAWDREQQRLRDWLAGLPRPVGVMACYDQRAQQILELCRELDLAVPEVIAVIGVDNDPLLCELCDPPLSSVAPDTLRTGFMAAERLDRMMAGDAVTELVELVPPLGVCTRQSTDVTAIDDPHVAAALRFIREHACLGIQVRDVVRVTPLSRRVLESRFRVLVGRTPHEEIMRIRMQQVKTLLAETGLTLLAIAKRTGFNYVEYMNEAFKKHVGVTPGQFRKQSGAALSSPAAE